MKRLFKFAKKAVAFAVVFAAVFTVLRVVIGIVLMIKELIERRLMLSALRRISDELGISDQAGQPDETAGADGRRVVIKVIRRRDSGDGDDDPLEGANLAQDVLDGLPPGVQAALYARQLDGSSRISEDIGTEPDVDLHEEPDDPAA